MTTCLIIAMSLFFQILDEHRELLKSKGYDETGLNSPDKEGWFARQLELHFSKSLRDAHVFDENQEFELQSTGFFNQDNDIVLFKFKYEYTPEALELNLKSITAKMGMIQVSFTLAKNADLPSSTSLHKEISKQTRRLQTAQQISNQETIKTKRKLK